MSPRLSALIAILAATTATAAPERSLRPIGRPAADTVALVSIAPNASLRPSARPAAPALPTPAVTASAEEQAGFEIWVKSFRPRAVAAGITGKVYDRAFKGVRYDPEIVRRDKTQSEFTKTIWEYLDSAASDTRIANGKAALAKNARLLDRIEAAYGVDKEFVVAIWGLESAYGTFRGNTSVISAMATLAYEGRRRSFFEGELLAALKILQSGDTTPDKLQGSWAGAMGHTQFIPGSYQRLAVDFNGDGRRDIWSDDPTDALASTAHYLKTNGWVKGLPWGVEVTIPEGFDYELANRDILKLPSDWARLGIQGMDGRAVPDHGKASILLPAGAEGAAFMIFKNFDVIETYNTADAYVIGVGHLANRITGAGPIRSGWPREDRALTFNERIELQQRLTAQGFDTRKIDGKIGPLTIAAVRAYQKSVGLVPDGYASLRILKKLR
ncbi:lytic murein transglycosylase [Mesobacterium sp. TK19101]|uniref:Lytic murein transglycosylase n=1 Tax=Mesobacterium hydrothermale TaxID=3111907 RepID=A0ABU6HBE9_9RHOB|nr:lytic murein transglycosylase [Mesobacterium sp. TK19101]MEC3859773.1 lytic murein transglycosylase [Mesobacterium sp. TK19101]